MGFGIFKKVDESVLDFGLRWVVDEEVDSWKLEKRKSKNLLKLCSANANQVPNAKNLSTLFRGLHFYAAKTTIKSNQNKILGLAKLSVWNFQNQSLQS